MIEHLGSPPGLKICLGCAWSGNAILCVSQHDLLFSSLPMMGGTMDIVVI